MAGKRAVAAKQRPSSDKRAAPKSAFKPGNPYRWKPGESGNPSGARKGPRLSDLLHEALQAPMPANQVQALQELIEAGATIGEIIAWVTSLRAAGGDLEAMAAIADRTEGAPTQELRVNDLTGDELAKAREHALAWEQARFGGAATPAPAEAAHGQ